MFILTNLKQSFLKYAQFSGRSSRSEYWSWILFCFVLYFLALIIDKRLALVLWIVFLVPSTSVTTRRLHDVNKSGWWQLLLITVLGDILLLYWLIKKGDPEPNRFDVEKENYSVEATGSQLSTSTENGKNKTSGDFMSNSDQNTIPTRASVIFGIRLRDADSGHQDDVHTYEFQLNGDLGPSLKSVLVSDGYEGLSSITRKLFGNPDMDGSEQKGIFYDELWKLLSSRAYKKLRWDDVMASFELIEIDGKQFDINDDTIDLQLVKSDGLMYFYN